MILSFETPEKIRTTEEHNKLYTSDSGINGTYVSNMSDEDSKKFKAKHIKGDHERIEIRVQIGGVNCNIFVYKDIYTPAYQKYSTYEKYLIRLNELKNSHKHIKFSMNGKMDITFDDWNKINQAIEEAQKILNNE